MKKIIFCIFLVFLLIVSFFLFFHKKNYNYPVYRLIGFNNDKLYKEGTAFVYKIEDYAYLLTNYHVIDSCDLLYILIDDKKIKIDVLGYDEYNDIAVLKIAKKYVNSYLVLKDNNFNINDSINIITFEKNLNGNILSSIKPLKIHFNNNYKMIDLFKVNSNILDGNSGSPVVKNNQVIGMISMVDVNDNGGYAIPSKNLIRIVSYLESGNISIINLGIDYSNYDMEIKGVRVDKSYEGFPAFDYGLRSGDIIVGINEYEIHDVLEFNYYLSKYDYKDSILIKYYRDSLYFDTLIEM